MSKKASEQICIVIGADIKKGIQKLAKKKGLSTSEMMREALEKFLLREEKKLAKK